MVRWLRWHCPPDTGFEIRALAVWGRARYLSVTEAPHNTNFHTWMGKKQFCFFQTAETGNRTPDSGVKGSGANHYPRDNDMKSIQQTQIMCIVKLLYEKVLILVCSNWVISDSINCFILSYLMLLLHMKMKYLTHYLYRNLLIPATWDGSIWSVLSF